MELLNTKYNNLELSTQVLIHEALARHIQVEVLDEGDNFIRLTQGNKTEYIKQATRTSIDTYIAPLIMENKAVTKRILDDAGIRVPAGRTYTTIQDALQDYEIFRSKTTVIKPNSTNFGIGVVILGNNFTFEQFTAALKTSFRFDGSVIVEEYITGKEYRFLIIGNQVNAILHRVPAHVTGDGISTVKQLVRKKNKDPLRGRGYKTPLEKIRLGKVEKDFLMLQDKNEHTVPGLDEVVYLRKNSNISTGGDSIDYTDNVVDAYKSIAVKAAKAAGAKICGADIIIQDVNAAPNQTNYAVIELNFNPALHIHTYPYHGKNRRPAKAVLDLLGF